MGEQMRDQATCRHCRFMEAGVLGRGVCRRYAPRPSPEAPIPVVYWPEVEPDRDWCGEFGPPHQPGAAPGKKKKK
jgi:hypothetical protein